MIAKLSPREQPSTWKWMMMPASDLMEVYNAKAYFDHRDCVMSSSSCYANLSLASNASAGSADMLSGMTKWRRIGRRVFVRFWHETDQLGRSVDVR
jgi:hypothetical protein